MRRGLDADVGGQLMILAAIVLLVGFLALSAMVARVSTLAQETARERDDPFLEDADAVRRGMGRLVDETEVLLPSATISDANYEEILEAGMERIELVQLHRGYLMGPREGETTYVIACDALSDTVTIGFRMTDGSTTAEFEESFLFAEYSGAHDC